MLATITMVRKKKASLELGWLNAERFNSKSYVATITNFCHTLYGIIQIGGAFDSRIVTITSTADHFRVREAKLFIQS